jgi:hypothetical protein
VLWALVVRSFMVSLCAWVGDVDTRALHGLHSLTASELLHLTYSLPPSGCLCFDYLFCRQSGWALQKTFSGCRSSLSLPGRLKLWTR